MGTEVCRKKGVDEAQTELNSSFEAKEQMSNSLRSQPQQQKEKRNINDITVDWLGTDVELCIGKCEVATVCLLAYVQRVGGASLVARVRFECSPLPLKRRANASYGEHSSCISFRVTISLTHEKKLEDVEFSLWKKDILVRGRILACHSSGVRRPC